MKRSNHHAAKWAAAPVALAIAAFSAPAGADLVHEDVVGSAISRVVVDGHDVAWSDLAAPKNVGPHTIRFRASGDAIAIPHCNGRGAVAIDGKPRDAGSKGPLVLALDGDHEVTIEVTASTYEKRIACSGEPRVGRRARTATGLARIGFSTAARGPFAGQAVVFVPERHDPGVPATVLVGLHPWNGTPWTYAAYAELLDEARQRDVVLLMPSGLGNSLYQADAEVEVMRALDALGGQLAVDPQHVSIWGASMGGAGATTIAFHRPDRFAFVASYFGDARYDRSTYVRSILTTDEAAHRVNPLDVVENARYLPLMLVHGESDRTSPIRQSELLDDAMRRLGYKVDFDRVADMGHEGPLVVRDIRKVVRFAAGATSPRWPARVTFKSVRREDLAAYGVEIQKAKDGDAFVDIERQADGIHVLRAENVSAIRLSADALGGPAPIAASSVPVTRR